MDERRDAKVSRGETRTGGGEQKAEGGRGRGRGRGIRQQLTSVRAISRR